MALLDDLVQEPSFRRFYLRWLAACWVPALVIALPFAICAIALWQRITPILFVLGPMRNLALPLFWILVALCQWWFLRPYSSFHRRWMAVIVLAGFAASFALFFVGGLIGAPTGILLAGWALWSSAAGMVLWWMRALQARRDLAQAQEVFD